MKPFCTSCQVYMKTIPVNHIVVTWSGPQWAGTLYRCPRCASSFITDWKYNAESLNPPDKPALRRRYFPYYFEESSS